MLCRRCTDLYDYVHSIELAVALKKPAKDAKLELFLFLNGQLSLFL